MTRHVTLVCGPPCAGKTTWVANRAQPGDTVLDIDELARRCGSDRDHNHEGRYYRAAQTEYDALLAVVRSDPTRSAWVIRSAPEPAKRRELADRCGATRTVVLFPPQGVLHTRALQRDPAQAGDTLKAITRWVRRYKPAPSDVLITTVEEPHDVDYAGSAGQDGQEQRSDAFRGVPHPNGGVPAEGDYVVRSLPPRPA